MIRKAYAVAQQNKHFSLVGGDQPIEIERNYCGRECHQEKQQGEEYDCLTKRGRSYSNRFVSVDCSAVCTISFEAFIKIPAFSVLKCFV
jgi:hypothetical protein